MATDDDAATVGNGAVDLGEGYRAAGIMVITESREYGASLRMMGAVQAPGGSLGRSRVQVWVDCTLSSLGRWAMRGTVAAGMMLEVGALVVRKWLVAPESRMAQLLMVAASVDIVLRRMETASA